VGSASRLGAAGADRCYNLVSDKFFNNETFFRVVPNFNRAIRALRRPGRQPRLGEHPDGGRPGDAAQYARDHWCSPPPAPTLAPPSSSSNLGDNTRLDALGFAPFATVTEGMESVDKIYSVYGQQPDQGSIIAQGDVYLKKGSPT